MDLPHKKKPTPLELDGMKKSQQSNRNQYYIAHKVRLANALD
jgi:hypothetical protein